MNREINEQTKRKRKMLLFLPLLVIPFLTLAFWAMGGGKQNTTVITREGLNTALPEAKIADDAGMDKMAFYDKADQGLNNGDTLPGSGKADEVMPSANDNSLLRNPSLTGGMGDRYNYSLNQNDYTGHNGYSSSATEERIRNRMQELQQQLRDSEARNNTGPFSHPDDVNNTNSRQIDQLNGMLQTTGEGEKDPEMEQLQEMMKRIYDIQHPEIVKEELKKKSMQNRGLVYPVNLFSEESPVSLLSLSKNDSLSKLKKLFSNGFYGLDTYSALETVTDAGIKAVVQDNIAIVNGATVKMRLSQDIYINGIFIPRGNFINGTASLNNDRVQIVINSVLFNNSLYSVGLSAYDMDGMEGIYVPGSISRDVARQSGNDAIQSVRIGSLDPSIGAQATAAGIETAKSLLSKKIKLVRVFIKAGHQLLLKDNNKQ